MGGLAKCCYWTGPGLGDWDCAPLEVATKMALWERKHLIQVSCVAFYGCFSQARSQAFHFSLRVLNPFVLKLLKLELKDSAYFPKRPLHHRWQGTNKASGIWVLLLTQNCNRSFCRRLMFLSEIFETFESERFLRSLEICPRIRGQFWTFFKDTI